MNLVLRPARERINPQLHRVHHQDVLHGLLLFIERACCALHRIVGAGSAFSTSPSGISRSFFWKTGAGRAGFYFGGTRPSLAMPRTSIGIFSVIPRGPGAADALAAI